MGNYTVRKLDEHTWQLLDPFRTYLYLLEGSEKAVLLDAGNGFSGLGELVRSLTEKPVTVILTHGHFDHTGAAAEFSDCFIKEEDLPVLLSGFDRKDRAEKMRVFSRLFEVPLTAEEEQYLIDAKAPGNISFLKEGDVFDLGGRTLEVIETPGHTKGSICLLEKETQRLYSGDTVCNREILVYFDHSGTVKTVKESDEKLLSRRSEFTEIWPGHHECPLDAAVIEDYRTAAEMILKHPGIGEKISLAEGYKILYNYKSIGISYTESHIS